MSALTSCGQRARGPNRLHRLRVDRRQNRRFQFEAAKTTTPDSPESVVFQGAGVITPDGLPSLTCVDLMRGLGDGESLSILVQVRV